MKMLHLHKKRFTLIELIAVIIILAILVIVAIPKYADLQDRAAEAAADGVFAAAKSACVMNYARNIGKTIGETPANGGTAYFLIEDWTTLTEAMEEAPEGWENGEDPTGNYTITFGDPENADGKAVIEADWRLAEP